MCVGFKRVSAKGGTKRRATINYELSVLKMLLKRMCEAKAISENPSITVKKLSNAERKFHDLTVEEEKRYLLACPQSLQNVATLMLETGMRCNESYQLKRQDVFLDKDFLKVTDGKTKSSNRRVYLSEVAESVLKHRLKKFKGEHLFPQNDKDFKTQPTI